MFFLLPQAVQAASYVVDTLSIEDLGSCTSAPEDCSLHGAIRKSNANPGPDSIAFLPGLSGTIYAPAERGFDNFSGDYADTEDCSAGDAGSNSLSIAGHGDFDNLGQPVFPIEIKGLGEDFQGCFSLEGSFHEVSGLAFTNCGASAVKMLGATCSSVSNNHFFANGDEAYRNIGVAVIISQGDYGISKANTVSGNLIEDSQNSALAVTQGSRSNLITNNIIKNTVGDLDNNHGIEITGHYNILSGNSFLNNDGDGIGVGGGATYNHVLNNTVDNCDLELGVEGEHSDSIHLNVGPSFNLIEGNIFRCSYENGIHVGGDGSMGPIQGNIVRNNIVVDAGTKYPEGPGYRKHNGIAVDGASHDTLVEGNIVYGSTGYGVQINNIEFEGTPNSVQVKNNVIYDNADGGIALSGDMFSLIQNNVIYQNDFGISSASGV